MFHKDIHTNFNNLLDNYSFINTKYDFILGKNSINNVFNTHIDKETFLKVLNYFKNQNKWVEFHTFRYFSMNEGINKITIDNNGYKNKFIKKPLYSSILEVNQENQDINIEKYIDKNNKNYNFKISIYQDKPVTTKYINENDYTKKKSLIEIENENLFKNYFLDCHNNISDLSCVHKIMVKFNELFSINFEEIYKLNSNNEVIDINYKIYIRIEITNDINSNIDTLNTILNIPNTEQICEKINDILLSLELDNYDNILNNINTNNIIKKETEYNVDLIDVYTINFKDTSDNYKQKETEGIVDNKGYNKSSYNNKQNYNNKPNYNNKQNYNNKPSYNNKQGYNNNQNYKSHQDKNNKFSALSD